MNLPDALMAQVKQRASDEGRTVTSVVEQALWELIQRQKEPQDRHADLPVWDGGGPVVDVTPELIRQIEHDDEVERYLRVTRERRLG